MPRLPFHILDVFTDTRFSGNPLAVVHDADGLDTARCQEIAREFNLSETVFLMTPRDPVNTARVRIFTPTRELPFAGHPTIGTAVLLARLRAPEIIAREDLRIVLEEEIGPVDCVVGRTRSGIQATLTVPRMAEEAGPAPGRDTLAAVLSLESDAIGFGHHEPVVLSVGNPIVFVPLRDREAVRRARANGSAWADRMNRPEWRAIFLYAAGGETEGADFHARMFAPELGMAEDPATGSAVAAFAELWQRFERPVDGERVLVIEQGFEMGRPSLLTLGVETEGGRLVGATVGGHAVLVAEGTLL